MPAEKNYWTYSKICILKDLLKHSILYLNKFLCCFIINSIWNIYHYTKVKTVKCISPTNILKFMLQCSLCFPHHPWQRSSSFPTNFFKVPGIVDLLELQLIKIYLNNINVWTKQKFVSMFQRFSLLLTRELNIYLDVVKFVIILDSGKTKEW